MKRITVEKISDEEWIEKYMPIPVIIYQEDMEGRTIDKVAGQIDILPTLYDLFNIKSSSYFGESMLDGEEGDALILKRGLWFSNENKWGRQGRRIFTRRSKGD
ncbi:hypothetical protein RCO48_13155 [Peribacillus frigoritolerans]|nr:hypothetical protein [Peribacillus frigoritolerans]